MTLEAGDTFGDIAKEYNVDVTELMDDNSKLDPSALPIGSKITVDTSDELHFMELGYTVSKIGAEYNLSVDELVEWNPALDENIIHPGMCLVVEPGDDNWKKLQCL